MKKEIWKMNHLKNLGILVGGLLVVAACAAAHKATLLPFRAPSSYPNATQVEQAVLGAQAFTDSKKATGGLRL